MDSVPPWYSLTEPKPVNNSNNNKLLIRLSRHEFPLLIKARVRSSGTLNGVLLVSIAQPVLSMCHVLFIMY